MRAHEIEVWALRIIENVNRGRLVEDSRVELKADFIEPKNAARIIAAHANTAQGIPILWLIGVDEKKGVTGVNFSSFADWIARVFAQFDSIVPQITDIHVDASGKNVLALLFETDRAPFVVKNPDGGRISFEVPWRTATMTRTANRSELLKILSSHQQAPSFEVLSGKVERNIVIKEVMREGNEILSEAIYEGERSVSWSLRLMFYIIPGNSARIFIPNHYCKAHFDILDKSIHGTFHQIILKSQPMVADDLGFTSIRSTKTEAIIDGAGVLLLEAETTLPGIPLDLSGTIINVMIDIRLPSSVTSNVVTADLTEVSSIPPKQDLPRPTSRRIVYKEQKSNQSGEDITKRRPLRADMHEISFDPVEHYTEIETTVWRLDTI
jgi:hypothetical protein